MDDGRLSITGRVKCCNATSIRSIANRLMHSWTGRRWDV